MEAKAHPHDLESRGRHVKEPVMRLDALLPDQVQRVDETCDRFEAAWHAGQRPGIKDYVYEAAQPERALLLHRLIELDIQYRRLADEIVKPEDYAQWDPEVDLAALCPAPQPPSLPERIGPYCVVKLLGQGGFGRVYLAHDDKLDLHVAIKVPHAHLLADPSHLEAILAEARLVAKLDEQPNIVRLRHIGSSDDFPCYVVLNYIDGLDLKKRMDSSRLSIAEGAELVASVAEALHYVHRHGVVHRDIKPSNILLDSRGKPYVADFGLALKEESLGSGPRYAGTYPYMSPEQARGEGHRVDGRSDIFSLSVVFYELLTGRRPFRGRSRQELLEQITTHEPRPPRQFDDAIPKELERICLKALSKRASERYTTAGDIAEELRHFWEHSTELERSAHRSNIPPGLHPSLETPNPLPTPVVTPVSSHDPVRIMPKGLRSFDEEDKEFFLDLLPGPRDRENLPNSIRFWKTLIERKDADDAFSVGLIYGPSGCGKSSLVKAGLLPRLSEKVTTVYIEATADDTEAHLLKGLRKHVPDLAEDAGLKESVASLRRGHCLPSGRKVLIIIDQFEQWLHARPQGQGAELVQALRQCDGARAQCIVMVRDDFWLAATRFMQELEIDLLQGLNSAVVDLFDLDHARKVLADLGRAFGRLPDKPGEMTRQQKEFLRQAVSGLAQDGKVVCVRLSLFAEMVKDKPWLPETLKNLGGMERMGVHFLEETFTSPAANPNHKRHQKAAQAVLGALLPETGTDIKGNMHSEQELLAALAASGHALQRKDFADLMRVLVRETRLVMPTDPEGVAGEEGGHAKEESRLGDKSATETFPLAPRYYQLTHDYLVRPLREWLTHLQAKTWRGRAELSLKDRTAEYKYTADRRFLPSVREYAAIMLGVPRSRRTAEQQALMRAAARFHGLRWGGALAVVLLLVFIGHEYLLSARKLRLEDQIHVLLETAPEGVPFAIDKLMPDRPLAASSLQAHFEGVPDFRHQLRVACALSAFGAGKPEFLTEAIARAPAAECKNIVQALQSCNDAALGELRAHAGDRQAPGSIRVRYAIVLLHLGDTGAAKRLMSLTPDPTDRTTFIHSFKLWHGDLQGLARLLQPGGDDSFLSGLCAALGQLEPDTLGDYEKDVLQRALSLLYSQAPGPGTHSAAGWALRQWKASLPALPPTTGRHWFVNRLGMNMLPIKVGTFVMGDPQEQDARPHQVRLTRPFFIGDRQVSVDQFRQFMEDPDYSAAQKPLGWTGPKPDISPTHDCPVQMVNWYDVLLFCNWLSHKEGLESCYRQTGEKEKIKVIGEAAEVEREIWVWLRDRNGYRLPTEAEWEYACRAGTVTKFSFGNDVSLLSSYGVFRAMRASPNASLLPNAWGLFDMHGNVLEWCWDRYGSYPEGPAIDPWGPAAGGMRLLRGGAYFRSGEECASAPRTQVPFPIDRLSYFGFRVVCNASRDDQ
jgi:serine/threonine protein kinase/formylglycine-generating enzyme required for sulfatase activity